MWGYESRAELIATDQLGSYESPCGVMRRFKHLLLFMQGLLRIPMWGYEKQLQLAGALRGEVTNPHVGL